VKGELTRGLEEGDIKKQENRVGKEAEVRTILHRVPQLCRVLFRHRHYALRCTIAYEICLSLTSMYQPHSLHLHIHKSNTPLSHY
jgi:hypothetical protein